MTDQIRLRKRDGSFEDLDLEKIHKVVNWACHDITGVSASQIEIQSQLQFYDQMESSAIHETLTKTAANLISPELSNYQAVASRLVNFNLRKEAYGQFEPWHLTKIVERNVGLGYYTSEIQDWYTAEDLNKLNKYIKHDRDYDISYTGMGQWLGKYLVQNRVTDVHYETPQVAYMMIAATLYHNYPADHRLKLVRDFYNQLSTFVISIPTPVLGGARTKAKQFSSCVLIDVGDNLDSINASTSAVVNYVSQKAGIGLNMGRIRGLGSEVRNGEVKHTGMIPFLKYAQAALKSCSQGGIRGGAATVYYPFFHSEFESLIVLKNNKGTEETRVRQMDYGVQLNRLFYLRIINDEKITLFSPHEVPDLMDAFYEGNNEKFEELYVKYERSRKLKIKTKVKARDMISTIIDERQNTGRIYIQNIDHCNTHGAFDSTKHPISQSNLCLEIALPTRPFQNLKDENGRIALCTLSATNWGAINKPSDLEKPCELIVRGLDELLSYQDYPQVQAALSTEEFRTLGIGVTNLAYFLAKNGSGYTHKSALALVDEYMEAMSFYLIRASVQLAKEKGPCKLWKETKYGQGIFPWETANKNVEKLIPLEPKYPWEDLRKDMLEYGIRNATLMAIMPAESSSQLTNATNGIEPPRGFVSEKASKDGVFKQVVPEYNKYKNKYELLWDQPSPTGYLEIVAVFQRWMDQAISANTSYNPGNYPAVDGKSNKLPLTVLIKDIVNAYSLGIKTLYYSNTFDGNDGDGIQDAPEAEEETPLDPINYDDEYCEGCSI